MLATMMGKFAWVCIEIYLKKPLRLGYRLKGKCWQLCMRACETSVLEVASASIVKRIDQ